MKERLSLLVERSKEPLRNVLSIAAKTKTLVFSGIMNDISTIKNSPDLLLFTGICFITFTSSEGIIILATAKPELPIFSGEVAVARGYALSVAGFGLATGINLITKGIRMMRAPRTENNIVNLSDHRKTNFRDRLN